MRGIFEGIFKLNFKVGTLPAPEELSKRHLPETLHIESPDVYDEKLSKEFWRSKKSASYNQTIFFAG